MIRLYLMFEVDRCMSLMNKNRELQKLARRILGPT